MPPRPRRQRPFPQRSSPGQRTRIGRPWVEHSKQIALALTVRSASTNVDPALGSETARQQQRSAKAQRRRRRTQRTILGLGNLLRPRLGQSTSGHLVQSAGRAAGAGPSGPSAEGAATTRPVRAPRPVRERRICDSRRVAHAGARRLDGHAVSREGRGTQQQQAGTATGVGRRLDGAWGPAARVHASRTA